MNMVILALIAALAASGWYARQRVKALDRREEFRDDFFQAVTVLVDRDDTPQSVVDFMMFVAEHIDRRRAPWILLWILFHGEVRGRRQEPSDDARQFGEDVDALPQPLNEQFAKASVSGALALSYNSVFIGGFLRRLALYRVQKLNKKRYSGADEAEELLSAWASHSHHKVAA